MSIKPDHWISRMASLHNMIEPFEKQQISCIQTDGISSLSLLRTAGSDLDVVNAARVSFGSMSDTFGARDEKLIHYLLSHAHTSPFEHTHLVFYVKLPLFIARQWMRHRIGVSYNEVSGRYTQVPLEFYTPKQWRTPDARNKQGSVVGQISNEKECYTAYKDALETCSKVYEQLLQAGVAKELARGVLPVCTYTQFIFTCNLISLFHFVKLRYDHHAQWEIQQYAQGMLELALSHFPISIATWCKLNGCTISDLSLLEQSRKKQPVFQP